MLVLIAGTIGAVALMPGKATAPEPVIAEEVKPTLTHEQETWIRALEWCESRGNPEAVNEMDLDGTPSYGAFQFKPSTYQFFALKYGVEPGELMDREIQYQIVEQMVLHRDEIRWGQQFPWCVKKLGAPPAP